MDLFLLLVRFVSELVSVSVSVGVNLSILVVVVGLLLLVLLGEGHDQELKGSEHHSLSFDGSFGVFLANEDDVAVLSRRSLVLPALVAPDEVGVFNFTKTGKDFPELFISDAFRDIVDENSSLMDLFLKLSELFSHQVRFDEELSSLELEST